jgi:iron(III) transport system substrate-binding protein
MNKRPILSRRAVLQQTALGGAALLAGSWSRPGLAQAPALLNIEKLHGEAKREAQITYYCSDNPVLTQRVVDAFNKTYPEIHVEIVRLATGPLGKRYATEAEAGHVIADLVQLADPILFEDAAAKGWLAPMTDLPAHASYPAGFKAATNAIVGIGPTTITYNTNLVKGGDIPNHWEDLINPKWKGQILAADPRNSPILLEWVWMMQDLYGAEFLKKFAAQDVRYIASTVPGTQQLAAGEAALLAPNQRQVSFSVVAKGGPVDDTYPTPMSGHEATLGISSKAPHPNAARLLANFIMTPQGQEAVNTSVGASPLPNIPGTMPLSADYRHPQIKEAVKHQAELLALLQLT